MKLKLNNYWTEHLLKYSETGMGYQKVTIVLKSGHVIKDIVVLNAEELVLPNEHKTLELEQIENLIEA
jgi:hypothetical protein